MASVTGSRLAFYAAGVNSANVNVALTATGAGVASPVTGDFNIEVFTSTAGSLAAGYNAAVFIQGAQQLSNNAVQAGTLGSTEQILSGSVTMVDMTGKESISIVGPGSSGPAASDSVIGSAGDTITGSSVSGNSQYIDGSGTNAAVVAGAMTIIGGAGATTVAGGVGDSIAGGAGGMTVDGSRGGQTIVGGAGGLTATGATITGAAGDSIVGATGATSYITAGIGDTIVGGGGATTVAGSSFGSSDSILGSTGAMVVYGGKGDKITGGAGALQVNDPTLVGNQTVVGGAGALSVFQIGKGFSITGSTGSTTIVNDQYGGGGGSKIVGGSGTGDISVSGADTGANTIIFAASTDAVTVGSALTYVDASKGSVSVQGGNGTVVGNPIGAPSVAGAAFYNTNILSGASDAITLGSAATFITATSGTTTITGGAGFVHVDAGTAVSVKGAAGALEVDGPAGGGDTVVGGAGNVNVFDLGKGSTITGGSGTNVINESYTTTVAGTPPSVVGVSGNSSITGGSGTVTGAGGLAVNTLVIGAVGDTVTGGAGSISVNGLSGSERITGGTGAMTVQGGALDTITGGGGTLQAFLNATGGAETVNLGTGHGVTSLRDVASNISVSGATTTFGAANGSISVTGFASATDIIQSKTSVNASGTFLGTSTTAGGNTTLTFVDGSTMTLVGVTGPLKFTQ